MISLTEVRVGEDEQRLVLEVLRSGALTQGRVVEQLESLFADVSTTRHCVAVNNGTSALIAALRVIGVGAGDEVITSPFTFIATVNAILATGATVRFADIGDDFNVDPDAVAAAVTDRTRALLPVHLYGQMCDMPAIADIASRAGVAVVEDAAQAHGASVAARPAGSFGVGCFSLYATKNIFAGEGGLVTTDDDSLADRLRAMRNQGMRDRYDYVMVGDNLRMTDVHAAIAVPQMQKLHDRTEQRRRNAAQLLRGLAGVDGLELPSERPDRRHVWHQFTVRVRADAGMNRSDLRSRLEAAGVGSAAYYPRIVPDYDCYRSHPRVVPGDFPRARRAAEEVLSLPVHPWLTDADISHVISSVRGAFDA